MDDLNKIIKSARRRQINSIRRLFNPRMWDSGYRTGGMIGSPDRRALKLWAPKDKDGEWYEVKFKGFQLTDFCGISEEGIIVDAYGGGCMTASLASFPLEDLIMLEKWAIEHFKKLDKAELEEASLAKAA